MTADAGLLEGVPFLAVLPPEEREELAACLARRQLQKGDIIFQRDDPGQSLFIVERGAVRIYVPSSQGMDLTLAVLGPGDFFGDLSLLDGRSRSASAIASEQASLLVLDRADFLGFIGAHPQAAMAVLMVVAQRLREADEKASDLAFLDVAGRLAKRLLDLAASHGISRADGILIDLSLTQEELANMIGVTRESVNRNLSEFRRLGLVVNQGRRLLIRDAAALRRRYE